MRYQISSISGFAKLTKLKEESKVVETPTLMETSRTSERKQWIIGDRKDNLTLNLPANYLSNEFSFNENYDFQFIANLLMHKSLEEKIIEERMKTTLKTLRENAESYSRNTSLIVIQPTKSEKILDKILAEITKLNIQNVAITNILPKINNSRSMVSFLAKIRTTVPLDTTLFLLSPVPHTHMPILAYAGIDIFSNGFANIAAKQQLYLTDKSGENIKEITEVTCNCDICSKSSEPEELILSFSNLAREKSLLALHNERIFQKKIREIRAALKKNDLRGYIEKEIQINPFSAGALRLLDKEWSEWLIARTPTWSSIPVKSITSYGFTRPSILAFQRRIKERFSISASKKVVVILPCSARKPYSESKSHQKFRDAITSANNNKIGYIQELILTSPLGVIPRELELVYPAAHYDIPVTGDWSQEEKQIAIDLLVETLTNVSSDITIIAHVTGEYIELCEAAEKVLKRSFIYTSADSKTTASNSLTNLTNELQKILDPLPPMSFSFDTERIQKVTDYQFGKGIGEAMFPEKYTLKGRPPLPYKIIRKNQQQGVIHFLTGKLTLSMKSGEILAIKRKYFVMFEGEKLEGSTLFAVGVKEADPEIRPSDEIVIVDKNYTVLGIGHALLSGRDMTTVRHGAVAKIKNKVK